MFDTMTWTKIVGSVCGALLIFLLLNWAGRTIYNTGESHGAKHGEHKQGYVIEVPETTTAVAEEKTLEPITPLLASADAVAGEKVFRKCAACHKVGQGENGIGPHLYRLIDREVAVIAEFGYSSAMSNFGGNWDVERLSAFLENPRQYVKGTSMSFIGLRKAKDRANIIKYFQSVSP